MESNKARPYVMNAIHLLVENFKKKSPMQLEFKSPVSRKIPFFDISINQILAKTDTKLTVFLKMAGKSRENSEKRQNALGDCFAKASIKKTASKLTSK